MMRRGYVNYHVHKPEQQAFHIDARGIAGNLISPELNETEINVHDVRDGLTVDFAIDSVGFTTFPSTVTKFTEDRA